MRTIEYHSLKNKLEIFGEGPWIDEPDKIQWEDKKTGLPCLIRRNPVMGILCGYVGVPKGHPYYGVDYDKLQDLAVHGGLTFSDHCHEGDEENNICHVVEDGESDDVWWLGFDCGHCDDQNPHMKRYYGQAIWSEGIYRNIKYVKEECKKLARQISHDTCVYTE